MDYFGDPQIAGQRFIEQQDQHGGIAGRSEVLLESLAVLPEKAVPVVDLDYPSGAQEWQSSQLIKDLGYVGSLGVELAQTHGPVATIEQELAELV